MLFEEALRSSEIILAIAFIQQSLEHIFGYKRDRIMFLLQLALAVLLLLGVAPLMVSIGLFGVGLWVLNRFQGPYNGGSDRMGLLILICLMLAHLLPAQQVKEYVFGYLALQLILSYFMSGWVKIKNPDWRNGQALRDVFDFSAYPVSENLRQLANRPRLLLCASWLVIVFELLFPLSLINQASLLYALGLAAVFHLANAVLFGLNRFLPVWLAAYPSLLWLQQQVFETLL